MRLPNKSITYQDSLFSIALKVLERISIKPYKPKDLYVLLRNEDVSVPDFIETLDMLYCLRRIRLFEGEIHYVN